MSTESVSGSGVGGGGAGARWGPRDLSRTSVERLVSSFENGTLPRERRTEAAYLVIGLWYVLHHGAERALALMFDGMRRYESGRADTEPHAQRTRARRAWILRIAEFCRRHAEESPEGTIFRRILASPLARAASGGEGSTDIGTALEGKEPEGSAADRSMSVTGLLTGARRGEEVIADLFDLVYDELCAIAGRQMRRERVDHTLHATALVHEAFARLVRDRDMRWTGRRHFFGAAARAMRRVLVDHARYVSAERRKDPGARMSLTAADVPADADPDSLVALDEALEALSRRDARAAEVVHLRFFAGLTLEETAATMRLSVRTVTREWAYARAWLRERLE